MEKINNKIAIELAKNRADEIIIAQELDKAKNDFIEQIKLSGIKDEIKVKDDLNKPIKIKRPWRFKIKQFFERISEIIG
jgi:hypothetical protein